MIFLWDLERDSHFVSAMCCAPQQLLKTCCSCSLHAADCLSSGHVGAFCATSVAWCWLGSAWNPQESCEDLYQDAAWFTTALKARVFNGQVYFSPGLQDGMIFSPSFLTFGFIVPVRLLNSSNVSFSVPKEKLATDSVTMTLDHSWAL